MRRTLVASAIVLGLLAAGCGSGASRSATVSLPVSTTAAPQAAPSSVTVPVTPPPTTAAATTVVAPTTTTVPCALSTTPGTANTVPVQQVCSAAGARHFDTPAEAMTYLAAAWNTNNVQGLDYVTNPAGRQEMDSMATLMVNLQFTSCTANPIGDYTCYFHHDVNTSSSPTTYPNPMGYPPGEAVFTVAPAAGPGWYLTHVLHCG